MQVTQTPHNITFTACKGYNYSDHKQVMFHELPGLLFWTEIIPNIQHVKVIYLSHIGSISGVA